MHQFDSPGAPAAIGIGDMKLPPVVSKWMSSWGNDEFVRMVRAHGYVDYVIDSVGLSSISAACSDTLYDSFSVLDIEENIANVAKSIADAHLDAIELRRERNEYRAGLKMPPLALPVEREIERNPGMTDNMPRLNRSVDGSFLCSSCGGCECGWNGCDGCDGYGDCDGCGCENSSCLVCATGSDSLDDRDDSYDM